MTAPASALTVAAVTWMRDRNGNVLSFTYTSNVMTVTDQRGRQVTVTSNVADGAFGTCTRITFSGTGGTQRVIRVCQSNLQNVLRNTRPGDLQQTQNGGPTIPRS